LHLGIIRQIAILVSDFIYCRCRPPGGLFKSRRARPLQLVVNISDLIPPLAGKTTRSRNNEIKKREKTGEHQQRKRYSGHKTSSLRGLIRGPAGFGTRKTFPPTASFCCFTGLSFPCAGLTAIHWSTIFSTGNPLFPFFRDGLRVYPRGAAGPELDDECSPGSGNTWCGAWLRQRKSSSKTSAETNIRV